jgi:hypothetical protein
LPGGKVPDPPIPRLAPDLAVEVLSHSNTPGEMEGKREEYFEAGVAVVWMVDPEQRRVTVFTSPEDSVDYDSSDVVAGDAVLPGFSVAVYDLFAELDRRCRGPQPRQESPTNLRRRRMEASRSYSLPPQIRWTPSRASRLTNLEINAKQQQRPERSVGAIVWPSSFCHQFSCPLLRHLREQHECVLGHSYRDGPPGR